MFKKAIIPALVLAAASVAVPAVASAQSHRYDGPRYEQNHRGWQPIAQRKHNLDRRIDVGQRNGQLSRREATRLRGQLNELVRLEYSYQRGGLTVRERNDLDRRYDNLSRQVRWERADNNGRRR
ncbi:MAG: hypothetical protein REJ23_06560 [Brevundimonas sp.]|nr:hypothetical protein [Brevundimonas sp.]